MTYSALTEPLRSDTPADSPCRAESVLPSGDIEGVVSNAQTLNQVLAGGSLAEQPLSCDHLEEWSADLVPAPDIDKFWANMELAAATSRPRNWTVFEDIE